MPIAELYDPVLSEAGKIEVAVVGHRQDAVILVLHPTVPLPSDATARQDGSRVQLLRPVGVEVEPQLIAPIAGSDLLPIRPVHGKEPEVVVGGHQVERRGRARPEPVFELAQQIVVVAEQLVGRTARLFPRLVRIPGPTAHQPTTSAVVERTL